MRLVDADKARECFGGDGMTGAVMKRMFDELPTVDPVHAAGGCYCLECKYKDECIRRIEFIGRNFVLEQNTYEYHPLSFCSYGQRKETDLDEAIEKYLKIKEGGPTWTSREFARCLGLNQKKSLKLEGTR